MGARSPILMRLVKSKELKYLEMGVPVSEA